MSSLYVKTPLLRRAFGKPNIQISKVPQFLVKYEFFQPSGSFKSRGIGNLIYNKVSEIRRDPAKQPHVFSSSGGNAGLAAATASQRMGIPCTVVVPTSTRQRIIEKIMATGATIICRGDYFAEADSYLKDLMQEAANKNTRDKKNVPIYVHPFNHPLIWHGHSYIVEEILESLRNENIPYSRVKGIVCSVGGGGLYNGIIEGLERHSLANTIPIIGVETEGCEVLHKSLIAGKLITFKKALSVATSLSVPTITKETLRYAQKYKTKSLVLGEGEVLDTCLRFTDESNIVTEPACGATLHLGYHPAILHKELGPLSSEDIVILIACGGSATTLADLRELKLKYNPVTLDDSPVEIPGLITEQVLTA
ncbi:L-serine/L-threonine ammonia-lyase CHA1 Ecym_1006 [Eremothecium cymbalariae DBVPG|uniref:L-serine ammonia-lyase n=1 Tax=Eremothecium cymbalariae (strain CBS 270.75 / DBVPG 7215 / KCTC 17166 / NRRL Y-17582) TaxID=931890 RepID=G8JM05_ERECY|nr:hypothetical protein Ecym_1006 [Eremothecium cymbalariae DBVPG\